MPSNNSAPASEARQHQQQRVLACALCQQRKVKCDRKFPCTNCIRVRANCVPGTLVPRRRRFPERELLLRLRKYEHLLRENKIQFEPLHQEHSASDHEAEYLGDAEAPAASDSPSPAANTRTKPRGMWQAMRYGYQDFDKDSSSFPPGIEYNLREAISKVPWEGFTKTHNTLLFGQQENANLDLSTFHPDPTHIFRLWHVYLENVNPLLRVIHAPSLQGVIIETVGNLSNINPNLEALMFGIYCIAVTSLTDGECISKFSSSKNDLLTRYQFGCQQALMNCGFLRTTDRTCLTALFFYLCSIRSNTDPPTLSSLLAITVRIARRIGIHKEYVNVKCDVLEAELRRRLWWSIVLFDTRIGEMSQFDAATLSPIWDCEIPLNLHDSDLHPELKEPQTSRDIPTESLFVVVRSAVGNFVRNTSFFLDFHDPHLKPIAADLLGGQPIPKGGELSILEKLVENKYLRHCDLLNPLHFMTIWTTRFFLAKYRMLEQYGFLLNADAPPTDAQRDKTNTYALDFLKCDTSILTSPLVKGFLWHHQYYFPFPAYIQLFQDLRKRPFSQYAEVAWNMLSENYIARSVQHGDVFENERGSMERGAEPPDSPLFRIQARLVLEAWEARVAAFNANEATRDTPAMPEIVMLVKKRLAQSSSSSSESGPTTDPALTKDEGRPSSNEVNMLGVAAPVPVPPGHLPTTPWSMPSDFAGLSVHAGFSGRPIPNIMGGIGPYPFGWAAMDWGMGHAGVQ